ncbi:AraC family transcriptional regulator [Undibacterium oligocarboniphilum]|uniref:Helix-turn-helix transcriptional regulator n=1 Tax=Undibacterium oligocarboniphilum TaxID=666702 RepID=A0A850QMT4_9BURK|nr:helix-turn-helix transcriptional regulator [Undibacterium oligocarboniphilum]MBC3870039.1 helix-turn-helix transcriptional regulator [Undibacterium oligocarboniphilum]NVO78030.1 helix-turn-helix transcriptional regulator [Undibacterium oligocarboniphilum]
MPVPVVTHYQPHPPESHPTRQRPVRLVARNMKNARNLAPHHHPWGQLTYTPKGMLQVIADNTIWFVPPMRAIWIPPTITHEIRTLADSQLRVLQIHADASPFSGQRCVVLEVSGLLKELIAGMAQFDGPCARESRMTQVIIDELQHARPLPIDLPMPGDKRLKTLCELLLANPANNANLDQLARQAGASPRTLSRLFERELHMRFNNWRQQMRLARATPLIASGMPLSQVAAELGYTSQSAFSAMFKKTLGQPPSAFFNR